MDATLIRTRALAAMVVGARARNALRVVDAFERLRVVVVRVDDVATACDRLAVDMPHAVIVLSALRDEEREALVDRTTAIGAILAPIDPDVDDATFNELIDQTMKSAIEKKLRREADAQRASNSPDAISDEVDGGWDE